MEDKTLELMVRIASMRHLGPPRAALSVFYSGGGIAEARFDGRDELRRLFGRGGGERRGGETRNQREGLK